MEMILLIGIQATGKSSFCQEKFFRTHVRLNLDMLRTRRREQLLMEACLTGKTGFVVDNTNLSSQVRARFIAPAKAAGFQVVGYFFESNTADSLQRNATRPSSERIPDIAIKCAKNSLELPTLAEGFEKIFFVRIARNKRFSVRKWKFVKTVLTE